jgi:hypothetical protein
VEEAARAAPPRCLARARLEAPSRCKLPRGLGSIEGYVVDRDVDRPKHGVRVVLLSATDAMDASRWVVATGAQGTYAICDVPAGIYRLAINFEEADFERMVQVRAGHAEALSVAVETDPTQKAPPLSIGGDIFPGAIHDHWMDKLPDARPFRVCTP